MQKDPEFKDIILALEIAREAREGPLTDDKSAFTQWDLKLTNAFDCVERGYGEALKWLKEAIDRGEDPEDARPGASSEIGSARFGTVLIEHLREVKVSEGVRALDVDQLDRDLEIILIDKAKACSSILKRKKNINNTVLFC